MGWLDESDDAFDEDSKLMERRELVRGGRVVARSYRSAGGILRALEQPGSVRIRRIWGIQGGDLSCTPGELATIERALRWLKRASARWAAFSFARYAMHSIPVARLVLPGEAVKELRRDERWQKKELVRDEALREVARGVVKVASIWHPPEPRGPAYPTETGALVQLEGGLVAWCTRGGLEVLRDKGRKRTAVAPAAAITLYPCDRAFLTELRLCAAEHPQ